MAIFMNELGPDELRQQFDKLIIQMINNPNMSNGPADVGPLFCGPDCEKQHEHRYKDGENDG